MKINITIVPNKLSGYTNISPLQGDDIFNLNLENNCCTEIIADNILDYIPLNKLQETLTHYTSKLRLNGTLIVGGIESKELIKQYNNGAISMPDFNRLVYGEQNHPWTFKRYLASLNQICHILSSLGLKVTKKRIENLNFIVEAKRCN